MLTAARSGGEGYTICGMRLGGDQLADRAGCYHGILAPDLASVSCTGPASHLLAQNQQLPLCRGLICVQTLQACVLSIRGPWLSFSVK